MTADEAVRADREDRICEAADLYEEAIRSGGASLEIALNLVVLYWQAWDPGIAGTYHLSQSFLERAERRWHELLRAAQADFPNESGPWFWDRYITWIETNKGFSPEECRALLGKQPGNLEPYFYLYMISEGRECEQEALRLRDQAASTGTRRGRYVAGVITTTHEIHQQRR